MIRRPLAVLAAAATAAAVLLVPVSAQAVAGDVSGTVTGPGSAPLLGVPVKVYSAPNNAGDQQLLASTSTDVDGNYAVTLAAGTSVLVCFESPDYVAECWHDQFQDPGDSARAGSAIAVTPGGTSGIDASLIEGGGLSGVARTTTDVPINGAFVTARLVNTSRVNFTLSDSTGAFSFEHLAPGSYQVCAYTPILIKRCTADLGGPASYTVSTSGTQGVTDLVFATRPRKLTVVEIGTTRARWTWDVVPGAVEYRISVSASPTMSKARVRLVTGHAATFTGLTKGKVYYARVRALDANSTTDSSDTTPARPGHLPAPVVVGSTPGSLSLSWLPFTGAARYQIRLSSVASFAAYRGVTRTHPEVVYHSLTTQKKYYVEVRALRASGTPLTAWSPVTTATTP